MVFTTCNLNNLSLERATLRQAKLLGRLSFIFMDILLAVIPVSKTELAILIVAPDIYLGVSLIDVLHCGNLIGNLRIHIFEFYLVFILIISFFN